MSTPVAWNARRKVLSGNLKETQFWGSWMNFMKNGEWNPIDLSILDDSRSFSVTDTPYAFSAPKRITGEIYFGDNSEFDKDTKKIINKPEVGKTKTFLAQHDVEGRVTANGILYKGAFDFGDIILQPGHSFVRNCVVFNEKPQGNQDIEIPFIQTIDSKLKPKAKNRILDLSTEKDLGEGVEFSQNEERSVFIQPSYVWDSAFRRKRIKVLMKKVGNVLECKKIIPRSFLENAVYPVYTDTTDTFDSDTADGAISYGGTGESFATVRAKSDGNDTGNVNASATELPIGGIYQSSTWYGIFRCFFKWDTSAIPDGNTASSASVSVRYAAAASYTRNYIWIKNRQSVPLVTTDFDLIGASGIDDGDDYGNYTRNSSDGTNTDYSANLSAAFLTDILLKTGYTYLANVCQKDRTNTTPTDTSWHSVNSGNAGSGKPTLSVTHSAGGSTSDFFQVF